ncbi:MAG: hypothetical protein KA144_02125 [Xanthomonadaceae bacterium]|nr:hypothetical protein [Xanthomonadaceae bacterium]MBP7622406.1 hypothetical protein [Xanthomonadales bacterium]
MSDEKEVMRNDPATIGNVAPPPASEAGGYQVEWKAAFIEERMSRYIEHGAKVSQAKILAETDASIMEIQAAIGGGEG